MVLVVIKSVVVAVLVGSVLCVLLRVCCPEIIDYLGDHPGEEIAVGVAVWVSAIALGMMYAVRCWKKEKQQPPGF